MSTNTHLINPAHPGYCEGSVDIDSCLRTAAPNAPRWDYIIGYNGHAYFIEVHPASGGVSNVIAKCNWLRTWLKLSGQSLAAIHKDGVFHWRSTGGVNIIGKDRNKLAQNKIVVNRLRLQ